MALQTRYDLGRYDLAASSFDIPIEERYTSRVSGVVNITYLAVELEIADYFSAAMSGAVTGTVAVMVMEKAEEGLAGVVIPRADIITGENMVILLDGRSAICCNMNIADFVASSLDGRGAVSVILDGALAASASLSGYTEAGSYFYLADFYGASLWGRADAVSVSMDTIFITLSIPPGAELRIDSENYLVTLDGENALYAQSGAWIKLSPNLTAISVDTGSGGDMRGSITYTELYL